MDINEIAKKILSATTLHFQNSLLTGSAKDDGQKQTAFSNMNHAEEVLTETLEEFRQLILKEASN